MNNIFIQKLQKKLGVKNLYNSFVNKLSFSEIQSFFIEVFDEKRKNLSIRDIFYQYENDLYVKPSLIDPEVFLRFDQLLFSHLPEYIQTLELSPVSPFGCCSQLGAVSQKRIISTIRKSEVCSDPTNVLAFEASRRRKENNGPVYLAVSQRLLRAEKILSKDTFPHFKVFSICFADRDKGNFQFEVNACRELALFYDRVISDLKKCEYLFSEVKMVLKFRKQSNLELFQKLLSDMNQQIKHLSIIYTIDDSEKWNYYKNIRFNLFIRIEEKDYFISDGGDTDWTQKILNNRKERYFISGLGSERVISVLNFK